MRRDNNEPLCGERLAIDKDQYPAGISAAPIVTQPGDIARGSAGDCCILCGKVGINLPLEHGCRPNIDVEAYRAQLLAAQRQGWWDR